MKQKLPQAKTNLELKSSNRLQLCPKCTPSWSTIVRNERKNVATSVPF